MENKNYYTDLVSLFEANLPAQEKIADAGNDLGSDIEQGPSYEKVEAQEEEEEKPKEDNQFIDKEQINDADYLSAEGQSPVEEPENVSETQRKLKIFDLMKRLLNYCEGFYESIEKIKNYGLLDDEQEKKTVIISEGILRLKEKTRNYLTEVFSSEKYEKVLYIYILLRTELITSIKAYREVLKLENDEVDLKKLRKKD